MLQRSPKKYIIPAIMGNILEMYEYALYGYFGPIIATLFFSSPNQATRLIQTLCVFTAGYLMRPLGGIVFGYFGDRYGRKKTLAIAIMLMAIPTTGIGLLPTYAQIGFYGCVLLTVCRLLQGIAVGGEFAGSLIYVLEHCRVSRRGLYGGWIWFAGASGFLLGSVVSALVTETASADVLLSWGWRIPFISGIFLGFIGLYLRLRMPETNDFLSIKTILTNPFTAALKHHRSAMLKIVGLIALPASAFFIFFVYLPSYLNTFLHVPLKKVLLLNSIAMLLYMPLMPLIGMLSDKIGRKPVLMMGAIGFIVFSYPGFVLLSQATNVSILIAQFCFGMLIACCYAPIPAIMIESFPVNVRFSAISLPFNIVVTLTGALTPLLTGVLIAKTHDFTSPSVYLMLLSVVMFFTIYTLKEKQVFIPSEIVGQHG